MKALALAILFFAQVAHAEFVVTPDHADGKYSLGDTVTWTIAWRGDNAPSSFEYSVKRDGLTELRKGTSSGKSISTKIEQPGTLLLEVKSGKDKSYAGAYAALAQVTPAAARPDDFNDFWATKIRELASVPPNPKLEKIELGEKAKPNVDYYKLTLDNIRGRHVNGQLARPTSGEKFPAILIVQWAGVYGLDKSWALDRAADGWLVLNILPHDLPIDRDEAFYKEQGAGALKNYWEIGNDDREQSYYLPMYLSCYRGAEYLASRDDWDRRTLVVMGASQGGQQSLVTAAIHPKITACLSLVPAGCDQLGPARGRAPGFPMWFNRTDGKDAAKVRETSKYFDVANFTPRIKCPVLVGIGLVDDVCPPTGIFAAVNQITSPKEVIILPTAGHQNVKGSQAAFDVRCWKAWLPALKQGQQAPVADR
ncbi:MAG: acetylxylan esterase [Anaerolineae bacterium]|nr:acetylxylan esterase [Phycisphaerae bacterium]